MPRSLRSPRSDSESIWNAGVDSVRAAGLVAREVRVEGGDDLVIGESRWSRADYDRVLVVGAGKAATAMAQGLLEAIGDWRPVSGWINVPAGTEEKPLDGIHAHAARPAGVNEPTAEGVRGTEEILRRVRKADQRELCLVLLSGGGSALLPAPVAGISLEDKLAVTRFLSAAGAEIGELNTVRKHLSAVKGGGLLRACRAGAMVTLILSDVLGDPLDLIASGPTVTDPSSPEDALAVLAKYDPRGELPDSVYRVLRESSGKRPVPLTPSCAEPGEEGRAGPPASCTKPGEGGPPPAAVTVVIGNNAVAVDEAGLCAERLGYNHVMHSSRESEGDAEAVGRRLAEMLLGMLTAAGSAHRTDCLITGGEPTVRLAPETFRGRGGRNQQLVLAAYQRLLESELSEGQWQRLCLLSGGTDGEDGPTDAAGAVLDAEVHRRATQQRLDPADYLRRNDAYTFFENTGGLLITGPTGTNVCDVRVALVHSGPP